MLFYANSKNVNKHFSGKAMQFSLKNIRTYRRSSQIFVALLFILIPVLNMIGIHLIEGDFFDLSFFGIPFVDPFFAIQTVIEAFARTLKSPNISFFGQIELHIWFGLFFAIILGFFLGPIFCSWACPYGLFSELVWKHLGAMKEWQTRRGDDKHRRFYAIKFSIFIICCIYVFINKSGPIGNYLSMPGWYSTFWSTLIFTSEVLFIPLAFMFFILVLEIIFKKRFWCLYFCPQSVILATMSYLSPIRMHTRFLDNNCTCPEDSKSCLKNCPLGLNSRKLRGAEKMQCVNCFECAWTCANGCKSYTKGIRPTFEK